MPDAACQNASSVSAGLSVAWSWLYREAACRWGSGVWIALELNVPLDTFTVRKLGTPGHRELAMGAVASGGVTYLNEDVVKAPRISSDKLHAVARRELAELERRELHCRDHRVRPEVVGRAAMLLMTAWPPARPYNRLGNIPC